MSPADQVRTIYRALFIHLCERPQEIVLPALMDEIERIAVVTALQQSCGNTARAAKILGINRTTLVEKRRRFGLEIKPPCRGRA